MSDAPRKRPAFESAAALVAPVEPDPAMPRPISTVAGGILVLLRAAAGVLWIAAIVFGWGDGVQGVAGAFSGDASDDAGLPASTPGSILAIVLVVVGLGVLIETALGVLIILGKNWPRVLVMVFSVLSISSSFVGWWAEGQQIRFETTFLTLSLDILILLALSSRSAATYARRHERR